MSVAAVFLVVAVLVGWDFGGDVVGAAPAATPLMGGPFSWVALSL